MTSKYRNWRKHETNSKLKDLSIPFAANANKDNNVNGITFEFCNENGERISFYLNEQDTKIIFMNIDRFYHGKKDAKREDYGLSKDGY